MKKIIRVYSTDDDCHRVSMRKRSVCFDTEFRVNLHRILATCAGALQCQVRTVAIEKKESVSIAQMMAVIEFQWGNDPSVLTWNSV